jgi:hypothetical protein
MKQLIGSDTEATDIDERLAKLESQKCKMSLKSSGSKDTVVRNNTQKSIQFHYEATAEAGLSYNNPFATFKYAFGPHIAAQERFASHESREQILNRLSVAVS